MDRRLAVAFRNLRKAGYLAKRNFWCCGSCGVSAIERNYPKYQNRYVFASKQSESDLRNRGVLRVDWAGLGVEIVRLIEEAGLVVEWSGNSEQRICIFL